jgi:serine/threonine protein kinase
VLAGRVIAEKYRLLSELGRGGMGSVWAADHLALRSKVAVKVIDPIFAARPTAIKRFAQEAQAAASLRSPHVVQVLDFGVDQGSPYLVMELLEGDSLGTRLAQRGALSAPDVWTVVNHIARAMTRAHGQGIVHRDLKPDNVFLIDNSGELLVKVLDFGVAKALTEPQVSLTETGTLLGTPLYASPEQAQGGAVDIRSDLWSLGVLAFECLTGRPPFLAPTLPSLLSAICHDPIVVPSRIARVPVGFDNWFARAVNRDRRRRFQSAKELAEQLRLLLGPDAPDDFIGPTEEEEITLVDGAAALRLHAYPRADHERRSEARIPSSIPAGINRRRDLQHAALIYNASRSGALLLTRHACETGQELWLTLHLESAEHGEALCARVVRASPHADAVWQFEVGVRFEEPLSDALLARLEAKAKPKSPL